MTFFGRIFKILLVLVICLFIVSISDSQAEQVDIITIDGIINPVSADFIVQSINRAEKDGSECLIMELDTPGGLVESTRIIVKKMLAADVPVIVFVTPSGARAASAGTFITIASHIAAMAPGTHIGAAHPVTIQGEQDEKSTMFKKIENDMAAYIKGIAKEKNRNVEWAEKAVRESVSITADEALKKNIIDLICRDLNDLLEKINGKKVKVKDREVTLKTAGAEINRIEMNYRQKFFDVISNPNIAYLLMTIGMLGLFFELKSPGLIFPGVVGVISLILAFYGLQTLPINYAGLALIVFGIFLFVLELYVASYGLLTTGGIISFILGSMMLIDTPYPFLQVSLKIIIPVAMSFAAVFVFLLGAVIKAHRAKVKTGFEGMIGNNAVAETDILKEGKIYIHGELWNAKSDEKIAKGETVKIIGREGMVFKVRKINEGEE
ncbi:MAG: nodulation protein NfeD [Candidatus Schekmanbacteria bacterium]|nr:MAG: nodulation protein NfeD [Candidatus Schekmanbacteria bacterium]